MATENTTIIRTSSTSNTGYELVIGDEIIAIDKTYPGEPTTLVLPENPSNRKYFSSKKVDAAGGELELTYKESKTFGPRTSEHGSKKPLEDYLNDEDKAIYLALVEKAKANRIEANKKTPMTEEEKLLKKIADLQKKIAALKEVEA